MSRKVSSKKKKKQKKNQIEFLALFGVFLLVPGLILTAKSGNKNQSKVLQ